MSNKPDIFARPSRICCSIGTLANELVKKLFFVSGANEFAAKLVPVMPTSEIAGGYSQMEFYRLARTTLEEHVSQLVLLIDADGNECLYINGVAWKAVGESTVYAADLAEAGDGHPFVLQHTAVERPAHEELGGYSADWPELLKDAAGWIVPDVPEDSPAEPQTNREPIIKEVLDAFACRESQIPPSMIDVLSVEPLKGGDLETELALNALLISPSKIGASTATGQWSSSPD